MKNLQKNTPTLRFPEFKDEWRTSKLGEISNFWNGEAHEQNIVEGGKYVVVNSKFISTNGKVRKHSNIQLSPLKNEDIAMVMSDIPNGKALAKCYLINEDYKFTLNQRIGSVHSTIVISEFLYRILNRNKHYLKFDNGVSQTNLRKSEILNCLINYPVGNEQQKIASFLTQVDEWIENLEKQKEEWEKYKKGMMQKIFSQEIRFKNDNGKEFPNWKKKKLEEIVIIHNSGVYKSSNLYGSGTNIIGISNLYNISSIDGQIFRKVPLSQNEYNEFTLNEGDLLYGESSLVREGIAKTLFTTKLGAGTSFAWHTRRYKIDLNKALPRYVYYFLLSSSSRKFLMSVATQTALTGITTHDYFSTPFMEPVIAEQQKIADFLTSIDNVIESKQKQINFAESWKKGLMQRMFI